MGSGEDTREARPSMYFALTAPDGSEVFPKKPDGTDGRWRWGPEKVRQESQRIEYVKGRTGWSVYYRIFEDDGSARPAETIWTHADVGSNRTSKSEVKSLFGTETTFTTPKPEALLSRVLQIATASTDLVMDSFLGSGTTAAVAHKMGRRWIGIEMGEHALTHCLPRLTKVVEGEQGGISAAVNWQGGGGFRVLQLGAPLFDAHADIHTEVRFADLAAFIWLRETGGALDALAPGTPLLGVYEGTAYILLFNGVLGDRRPASGNVLNVAVLDALRATCWHNGPKVIYGEACRLGAARLAAEAIVFKQLPHAVPR